MALPISLSGHSNLSVNRVDYQHENISTHLIELMVSIDDKEVSCDR